MKKLLIDSSFYVSLARIDDTNYTRAQTIFKLIAAGKYSCITTEDVLKESLTAISQRMGKRSSIEYYQVILQSSDILTVSAAQWQSGLHRFLDPKRQKDISVIDCVLWAVYEDSKADAILTFDQHFKHLGLTVLR